MTVRGAAKGLALRTSRALSTNAAGGSVPAANKVATPNAAKATKGKGVGGPNANKAKKGKGSSEKAEAEHLTKFMMAAEEAKSFKPQFTEEELIEHAKIARTYQRNMTKMQNKLNKDLSDKIWLQQEALRALPDNLRIKAEMLDETPPPADRPWPLWMTPPIPGFNPKSFMGKSDSEEDETSEGVQTPSK